MTEWLVAVAGTALILLAIADIFLTVLYARSGTGIVSPRIHQHVWRAMVRAVRGRSHRVQRLLSFGGPLMMVLSVVTWSAMLLFGSALIIWPMLGSDIQASSGPTPTSFGAALYFAGYSLTTLGVGDLVPRSDSIRLLTILLAVVGFSVVTLTLTYFMSVYSALVRRNVVSQTLHHVSGGSGNSADVVAALGPGGTFDQGRSQITTIASGVLDIVESNEAYPVLQYFRMNRSQYAVARIALLVLDSASLIRSALAPAYREFVRSGAVNMLWGSGLSLLGDAEKSTFIWAARSAGAGHQEDLGQLRPHFDQALRTLREAGIKTREDAEAAFAEYRYLRSQWFSRVQGLARCTGFEWEDISRPERRDRTDGRATN